MKEKIQKLTALQEKIAAYNHALSLLYYDGATTAPKGTAANRARSMSVLSEEVYKLSTGKETVDLLEELDARRDELTAEQQRTVQLMLRDIREMQKVPIEEYVAYQELLVESEDVWHTAKETNDFPLFLPYLEKVFDTNRKFAGYFDSSKAPYDVLLDRYEEGLSQASCDKFFDTLKSELVPLIAYTQSKKQVPDDCLWGSFPEDKQQELSLYLMQTMGLDLTHVGLSTTEHPFTTSLGSHQDVRITTHYLPDNFASSMFSVIHEGGHALYDSNSRESYAFTVLDGGVSMGIHESQSRFYENLLCRSRAFTAFLLPKLRALFPEKMNSVSEDAFYRAVNRVEPSLIRTEADEVTYCLHVMVRYELEKQVIAGSLAVKDLPGEWNRMYRQMLGIDVPDDRRGILQDSHWSGGNIGYFPSYALGSAYGAQFLAKMKETVPVDESLRKGDFSAINAWNREHIWQYGMLKTPGQLLHDTLNAEFDPHFYTDYLKEKYTDIYR